MLSKARRGLQNLIDRFNQSCIEYGLEINTPKINYMTYYSKEGRARGLIKVGNELLEKVREFDYLGFRLAETWSWEPQILRSTLFRSSPIPVNC